MDVISRQRAIVGDKRDHRLGSACLAAEFAARPMSELAHEHGIGSAWRAAERASRQVNELTRAHGLGRALRAAELVSRQQSEFTLAPRLGSALRTAELAARSLNDMAFQHRVGGAWRAAQLATRRMSEFTSLATHRRGVVPNDLQRTLAAARSFNQMQLASGGLRRFIDESLAVSQGLNSVVKDIQPQLRSIDAALRATGRGFSALSELQIASEALTRCHPEIFDSPSFRGVIEAWEGAALGPEGNNEGSVGPILRFAPLLSGMTLSSVFNVIAFLFSLYFFLYGLESSERMEARLTQGLERVEAKQLRADDVRSMFEDVLARTLLVQQYETLGRVAKIWESREPGASVVGEAWPGDVVMVTGQRGKWIRVRHVDPDTDESLEGWALKKYFRRLDLGSSTMCPL